MTEAKISRFWGTILICTIALTLCLILVGKTAVAAEVVDQSNLPEWAGGWTNINPTGDGRAIMWQTFTPACPNLTAVEIDILTVSPGRGDDTLTVEIIKGGDILASADCSVVDGFNGLLRFEFPDTVPLVPEQIYELKVHDTGKTRFGWKYGSNSYGRGSRYVLAQEYPNTDWFFRTFSIVEPAAAKYSGGTGEPNDPYKIATAEDLIALGNEPNDYNKHFILTDDIDLDPNLPGGRVFIKAVIAPDVNDATEGFEGTPFTGVFDGNGHTISHLTIQGKDFLGLFGQLGQWDSLSGEVRDLGVVDVNVTGSGDYVAGLVGWNWGFVVQCYSTGAVEGDDCVGGLVGDNYAEQIGYFQWLSGSIYSCYSTGVVSGESAVGGLVGLNEGDVTQCYSAGVVDGNDYVGALVGVGGARFASATLSFWDMQKSRLSNGVGDIDPDPNGVMGKTTAEMQTAKTFLDAGWDFSGETANGTEDIWWIDEGKDYPRLWWELPAEDAETEKK